MSPGPESRGPVGDRRAADWARSQPLPLTPRLATWVRAATRLRLSFGGLLLGAIATGALWALTATIFAFGTWPGSTVAPEVEEVRSHAGGAPIRALAVDPVREDVWLGLGGAGIVRLDAATFLMEALSRTTTAGGLPSDDVLDLAVDASGHLLVLTGEPARALSRRRPDGTWQRLVGGGRVDGLTAAACEAAAAAGDHVLLVYGGGQMAYYDRRTRTLQGLRFTTPLPGPVTSVAATDGGLLLVVAAGSVFLLEGTDSLRSPRPLSLPEPHVADSVHAGLGTAFVRTREGALLRLVLEGLAFEPHLAGATFPGLDDSRASWAEAAPDGSVLWWAQDDGRVGRYDPARGAWQSIAMGDEGSTDCVPGLLDAGQLVVPRRGGGVRLLRPGGRVLARDRAVLRPDLLARWIDAGARGMHLCGDESGARTVVAYSSRPDGSLGPGEVQRRSAPVVVGDGVQWIDTLLEVGGDGEQRLGVVTDDGALRTYDLLLRGMQPDVRRLSPRGPWKRVRAARDGGLLGLHVDGSLWHAPARWTAARPGGEIPLDALVSPDRLPSDDPVVSFATVGDAHALLAFLASGEVYAYDLDRGFRRERGDVDTASIRKLHDGAVVVRSRAGRVLVRDSGGWHEVIVPGDGAQAAWLGHGLAALPVGTTGGGVVRLERTVSGWLLQPWLPPVAAAGDGPVPPVSGAVGLPGSEALLIGDAGGVRTYELASHGWREVHRAPGASDWSLGRAGDVCWAFSPSRRILVDVVTGARREAPRLETDVSSVVDVTGARVVQLLDGSVRVDPAGDRARSEQLLVAPLPGLAGSGPVVAAAASRGRVLLLVRGAPLLAYDPLKGALAEVSGPWGSVAVDGLLEHSGTVVVTTADGAIWRTSASGASWDRLAAPDAGKVARAEPVAGGVLVSGHQRDLAWHPPEGAPVVLGGGEAEALGVGNLLRMLPVRAGAWLQGERGTVFWDEGRRAPLGPTFRGGEPAVQGWARMPDGGFLVSGASGVWRLPPDGQPPEALTDGPARDVVCMPGAAASPVRWLDLQGRMWGWVEGRGAQRLPPDDALASGLARDIVAVDASASGAVLATRQGEIAIYDPARRALHSVARTSGGGALAGVWATPSEWLALTPEGDLLAHGTEATEWLQVLDGVGSHARWGPGLWALRTDGELVHRVGGRTQRNVLPPAGTLAKTPVLRAVPVGEDLLLRTPGGWRLWNASTRRARQVGEALPESLLPLGGGRAAGIAQEAGGSQLRVVDAEGRVTTLSSPVPLSGLRGDGVRLAAVAGRDVVLLAERRLETVFSPQGQVPARGLFPRAAASLPGEESVYVLLQPGWIARYTPDTGTWDSAAQAEGDEILLVPGRAPVVGSTRGALDLATGMAHATRARPVRARGGVHWLDAQGSLWTGGRSTPAWTPATLGEDVRLAWALQVGERLEVRLSSAHIRIEPDGRMVTTPSGQGPPEQVPEEVLRAPERVVARFGSEAWEFPMSGGPPRIVARGVRRLLGVTQKDVVIEEAAGSVRMGGAGGQALVQQASAAPWPDGATVLTAPGAGMQVAVDATGAFQRPLLPLRAPWEPIPVPGLDRVVEAKPAGEGVEVRGTTADGRAVLAFLRPGGAEMELAAAWVREDGGWKERLSSRELPAPALPGTQEILRDVATGACAARSQDGRWWLLEQGAAGWRPLEGVDGIQRCAHGLLYVRAGVAASAGGGPWALLGPWLAGATPGLPHACPDPQVAGSRGFSQLESLGEVQACSPTPMGLRIEGANGVLLYRQGGLVPGAQGLPADAQPDGSLRFAARGGELVLDLGEGLLASLGKATPWPGEGGLLALPEGVVCVRKGWPYRANVSDLLAGGGWRDREGSLWIHGIEGAPLLVREGPVGLAPDPAVPWPAQANSSPSDDEARAVARMEASELGVVDGVLVWLRGSAAWRLDRGGWAATPAPGARGAGTATAFASERVEPGRASAWDDVQSIRTDGYEAWVVTAAATLVLRAARWSTAAAAPDGLPVEAWLLPDGLSVRDGVLRTGAAGLGLSLRTGRWMHDELVGLRVSDERLLAEAADGSHREWTGDAWLAYAGAWPESPGPQPWRLAGRYAGTGNALQVAFGGSACVLRWSAADATFDADVPLEVLPAAGGVYVRTAGGLWRVSGGARAPVVLEGKALASPSALRLEEQDGGALRHVAVVQGVVYALDGVLASRAVADARSLRVDPADGTWRSAGVTVDQGAGGSTRLAVDVAGQPEPTEFLGACLAHDAPRSLVARPDGVFVLMQAGCELALPGDGLRAAGVPRYRPAQAAQRVAAPDRVQIPASTMAFVRRGDRWDLEVEGLAGQPVNVPLEEGVARFLMDRVDGMAARDRTLAWATGAGVALHSPDAIRSPRIAPWPSGSGSPRIAFDEGGVLWVMRGSSSWRWSDGWKQEAASLSPLAPERQACPLPARPDSPWMGVADAGAGWSLLRLEGTQRIPVRYVPEAGNFDLFVASAPVRGAAGDEPVFGQATDGTPLARTLAGRVALDPQRRQVVPLVLLDRPWPEPASRVVTTSLPGLEIAARGALGALAWRQDADRPAQPLQLAVRQGRLDLDDVREMAAVPGTSIVVLRTPVGFREIDVGAAWPAGAAAQQVLLRVPAGLAVEGQARFASDGRTLGWAAPTGDVLVRDPGARAWVAGSRTDFDALVRKGSREPGALEGRQVRWERGARGVEFSFGPEGIAVPVSAGGFGLDFPADACALDDGVMSRVGGKVYWLPGNGALDGVLARGPAQQLYDVVIEGGSPAPGAHRLVVSRPDGTVAAIEAGGLLVEARPGTQAPWAAAALPLRITRDGGQDVVVAWPAGQGGTSGTLRAGRFLHDEVLDAVTWSPAGGREELLLATAGGLVRRQRDGRWLSLSAGDATAFIGVGDGLRARGAGGWNRVVARGAGAVLEGAASEGLLDIVYEDACMRVVRGVGGPSCEWKQGTSGTWMPGEPGAFESGRLAWDQVHAVLGPAGDPRVPGFAVAGPYVYRCDGMAQPTSGLWTVPTAVGAPATVLRRPKDWVVLWRTAAGLQGFSLALGQDPRPLEVAGAGVAALHQPWTAGSCTVVRTGPAPGVRVQRLLEDGRSILVRATGGCLDTDHAAHVAADGRAVVAATRASILVVTHDAGRSAPRAHHHQPPDWPGSARSATWRSTPEEGAIWLSPAPGRGWAVSRGAVERLPDRAWTTPWRQVMCTWPDGGLYREEGELAYRDMQRGLVARGASIFVDGRFAWDHGEAVRDNLFLSAHGLQACQADGSLGHATMPAERERYASLESERVPAQLDLLGLQLEATLEAGLGRPGRTILPGPIVGIGQASGRLWVAGDRRLWFLRIQSRWVDRLSRQVEVCR